MKEGSHEVHFSNETTQGKNIDGSGVGRELEEKLGCPIPPCGDVVGEWGLTSDFLGDTEIDDFDLVLARNKDVLRFDIAMKKAIFVDAAESRSNLFGEVGNFVVHESLTLLLPLCDHFK